MAEEKFYSALHWAKKAEKSADLAKQYGNDKLNITNITNCITEIPQDIKLELVDGVLTLKAGSKLYVPNGLEDDGVTPKFDEYILKDDFVATDIPSNTVDFFMWDVNLQGLAGWPSVHCYSGDTRPTVSGQYAVWYDTKNNVYEVKYGADTWSSRKYSLPICIATGNGTRFTSLDQVFNGFGCIGHTAWVSKGVKCLLPKGRNEDGSLKSLEYTTKFSLNTISTTSTSNGIIIINEPEEEKGERDFYSFWDKAIHVGKNPPSDSLIASVIPYSAMAWFNPDENICRGLSKGSTAPYNWVEESSFVIVGKLFRDTANNNKIKELIITADATNLIKRSDSYEVSSWGMPSSKYIDLTLGATGTSYVAPASGWFCLVKKATGGGQSIDMSSHSLSTQAISTASGQAITAFAPAAKGESVVIYYTTGGTTNSFRFIYAKGEI